MLRGRSRLIAQGDFLQLYRHAYTTMSISSQSGSIYTDLSGLDQLKYKLKGDSVADLRLAAQQFEALFIQQMMKTMREAKLAEGAFDSKDGDLYVEMLDKQLSLSLSQGKGLGLADVIVKQLSHVLNLKPEQAADTSADAKPRETGIALPVNPTAVKPAQLKSTAAKTANEQAASPRNDINKAVDDQPIAPTGPGDASEKQISQNLSERASFIKTYWPLAEKASQELGVAPQFLIAQAALETGWGRHIARRQDGSSSHNLFNIKAGANWQGDTVTLATAEIKNGVPVKQYAAFRAYDSFKASFEDYVATIKHNPRYQQALKQAANAVEYASALQQAGYATDPDYADKITQIAQAMPLKN